MLPEKGHGRAKAEPFPREEVSRRIEKAAREALLGLDSARLFEGFPGPYRFALTFQDGAQAETAAELHSAKLLDDGVSVEIRATDFEEGYRNSLRLISFANLVGRMQAMQAVIAAQPNAKDLTDAVRKSVRDRWFDPRSFPSASGSSGTPQRYFGARWRPSAGQSLGRFFRAFSGAQSSRLWYSGPLAPIRLLNTATL
jgi:hypothetical protein